MGIVNPEYYVGKNYFGYDILSYLNKFDRFGKRFYRFKCNTCGREFESILDRHYLKCVTHVGYNNKTCESICWHCDRCYDGCSWSKDLTRVPGSEAIIKTSSSGELTIMTKCPLFVQEVSKYDLRAR